ncbi:hypothetical protein XI06_12970 [Bradyrhizobium sp. CCBAU 11434]|nr:hypothetical protein [Bradyrhizobium sp. CCBAU 11434]
MVIGALVAVAPAQAAVVLSENFNGVPQGLNATNVGSNFSVTQGTVDVIGAGSSWDFYPGNGTYVDLDGSTLQLGTISSAAFGPGTYTLSFDFGAYTYNHSYITENLNFALGNFSQTLTPTVDSSVTPGASLEHYSVSFTTTQAGELTFSAINPLNPGVGTNVGPILDNVVLTAVPEASTWAMMIVGFLGLGFLAHRRNSGTRLRLV